MRPALLLLLFGGIALAAYAQQSGASDAWATGPDVTPPDPSVSPPDQADANQAVSEVMAQTDPQSAVAALLGAIRRFESNGRYDILYGGGTFSDFSQHPRIQVPIDLPGYQGKVSTAAGAYQINWPTYQEFAPALGISDFSPASQDAIALAILKKTGAYDAVIAGDVAGAFKLASTRWASLPGSTAGQNPQTLATALEYFNSLIGTA